MKRCRMLEFIGGAGFTIAMQAYVWHLRFQWYRHRRYR